MISQTDEEISQIAEPTENINRTTDNPQVTSFLKKPVDHKTNIEDFFKSQPKRLKKARQVAKEKEIKKLLNLKTFFEYEAELGSDNEQHDDVVKKINDEDDLEGVGEEEDLKDLVTNEIEEDKADVGAKYFDDMMAQDKEDIRRVIKGPEQMLQIKREREDIKINPDYMTIGQRLKKYKGTEETLYSLDGEVLFKNFQSLERLNEDESQQNPELKEMLTVVENNFIKKVNQRTGEIQKSMNNRMLENNKILENVINLNEVLKNEPKKCESMFFHKGNNLVKQRGEVMRNGVQNVRFNKNSLLQAISNDKHYGKADNNSIHDVPAGDDVGKKEISSRLNLPKSEYLGKTNNLSCLFKSGIKDDTKKQNNKRAKKVK
jgi:hypothetical protein